MRAGCEWAYTVRMHGTVSPEHDDACVIDALGGTGATAALCDVTSQAVSQWRRNGIPHARRMYLRVLRPEAFGRNAAADASNDMEAARAA